jgi:hypothetical protein
VLFVLYLRTILKQHESNLDLFIGSKQIFVKSSILGGEHGYLPERNGANRQRTISPGCADELAAAGPEGWVITIQPKEHMGVEQDHSSAAKGLSIGASRSLWRSTAG